jgi:hypothetical protein
MTKDEQNLNEQNWGVLHNAVHKIPNGILCTLLSFFTTSKISHILWLYNQ